MWGGNCFGYIMRFLTRTPVRTFIVYPIATVIWEFIRQGSNIRLNLGFLPLMVWGYLQYRWCGRCRIRLGRGGPGLDTPPEKLVSTGAYAYTRNPMYLGHLIFLTGLTLTLRSWFAALITIAVALWFHIRVIGDEKKLLRVLGPPYEAYLKSVKRWIPGIF